VAQAQAANIQLYEVPYQNWNNDTITNYTNAMTQINSIMPNPGGGTNIAGDTPQEVMFFVTDGVEDETVNGSRVQSLMNTSYCTTIKNRGIRIAVLYTTYLPLPTNSLVQQLHQAVPAQHRSEPAELRVARPLFPGVDRPGHLGRTGAALQYCGGNRASDEIAGPLAPPLPFTCPFCASILTAAFSASKATQLYSGHFVARHQPLHGGRPLPRSRICSFAPLAIGGFFLFSGEAALAPISESDAKLIVSPPHHVTGAAVAIWRPEPELVRDRVCPDA
jgi:hypothetical protein